MQVQKESQVVRQAAEGDHHPWLRRVKLPSGGARGRGALCVRGAETGGGDSPDSLLD